MWSALWLSIRITAVAVVALIVLGVPLGWLLARWRFRGRIVALPLMVQSVQAAIADVDPALENAARTLGVNELEIFWHITLPLARRGIVAGGVLGGARALGEFGATLMVAGNIPGRTQTLPLAIYDAVQNRQYDLANQMVLLMTTLAFLALWVVRRMEMNHHAP